ncbi:hypothetical protein AMECASPLE_023882 [Ameca splendens]|uniref:Uncharacterized protein n=1 Tax=Ameca splendens TaxID=208324 RepID=A0ABV0YR53_9TELE
MKSGKMQHSSGLIAETFQHVHRCSDHLLCPLIHAPHTSVSPHLSHFSTTLSSSLSPPSLPTPKACLFPYLKSSAGFSTLLSLRVLLSTPLSISLPRSHAVRNGSSCRDLGLPW